MKRYSIYSALLISLTFVLFGCGFGDAAKKAEKQAAKYHKFLMAGNANAMLDMIHEDGMAQDGENFIKLIRMIADDSEVTKVTKSPGFNTQINNGVTTVRLNYVLHDKNQGEITEEIVLQDSKDGAMKIISLHYE